MTDSLCNYFLFFSLCFSFIFILEAHPFQGVCEASFLFTAEATELVKIPENAAF